MNSGDSVIFRQTDPITGYHSMDFPAKFIRYVGKDGARIKFDDKNLLPPKMTVPIDCLFTKDDSGKYLPILKPNTTCPDCGTQYVKKPLFTSIIEICPKCDRRKSV